MSHKGGAPDLPHLIKESLSRSFFCNFSAINSFPNGATILLRDSVTKESFVLSPEAAAEDSAPTRDGKPTLGRVDDSEVITSYRAIVREKVGETRFETPSGSFFQNNRAILPLLIDYIRQAILDAREGLSEAEHYLVDTYCGSGLFALMLAPLFKHTAGIEIDSESIKFAKRNAKLNSMGNVEFLAGNAEEIFGMIDFPPERTTVVIDPPRRGCEEAFISQLVALSPALVVYVSCNVHVSGLKRWTHLRKRKISMLTNAPSRSMAPCKDTSSRYWLLPSQGVRVRDCKHPGCRSVPSDLSCRGGVRPAKAGLALIVLPVVEQLGIPPG